MKKILAAAIAATLAAASANAAITVTGSYTSDANSFTNSAATSAGQVLFDFSNSTLSGTVNGFTLSNNNTTGLLGTGIGAFTGSTIANGNTANSSAPTGDSTNYLAVLQNGTQTIANSATGYNTLSLLWGSPDSFNTITFLDQGGNSLGSITASSVTGLTSLTQSAFVTLSASQNFYGVTLSSSSNAFEVDNVKFSNATASVPEPASWAMMIIGFGAVGYAMRRRQGRSAHRVLG